MSSGRSFLQQLVQTTPPSFLDFPAAGIHITDSEIRCVTLQRTSGGVMLDAFDTTQLPAGTVSDGAIAGEERLIQALGDLKETYELNQVQASISSQDAYVFNLVVPPVKKADLKETAALHISEQAPLSASEAVFDFVVRRRNEDGEWLLAVTAIDKKIVHRQLSVLQAAGLAPVGFSLVEHAVSNTLPRSDRPQLQVCLGKQSAAISVRDGYAVAHTAAVDLGTDDLENALVDTVSHDSIFSAGLRRNQESGEVYKKLSDALAPLISSARRRVRFWQREARGGDRSLDCLLLCGDGASVPYLRAFLEEKLDITTVTSIPIPLSVLPKDRVPRLARDDAFSYQPAIGLALANINTT